MCDKKSDNPIGRGIEEGKTRGNGVNGPPTTPRPDIEIKPFGVKGTSEHTQSMKEIIDRLAVSHKKEVKLLNKKIKSLEADNSFYKSLIDFGANYWK